MDKNDLISILDIDAGCPKDKLLIQSLSKLTEIDPESVANMINVFNGEKTYNNFITKEEADCILSKFKNSNGSDGAIWSFEEVKNTLTNNFGVLCFESPYYNDYALYVTINMYMSDQYNTLVKWAGNSEIKMFEMCYDLAVNQLKDIDNPNWIRKYFNV